MDDLSNREFTIEQNTVQPEKFSSGHLYFISFIVFLDMLGFGIVLPVMPMLIHDISGMGIDRGAEIGGLLIFIYSGMQFLFAPLIGGLSDQFGRRPVLLTTLLLMSIDYALMAIAPTLTWLVVGRAISGVAGATWATAYACIADCVSVGERERAFGVLGGLGAAGFVLGPALGGFTGELWTRLPFVIASGLAAAGLVFGLSYFRETLPFEARRRVNLIRANPIGGIVRMAGTPFVLPCLFVIFLINLASQAQLSIWPFWGALQFGWSPTTSGLTVSLYGVLFGAVQAFTTGWLVTRFGAARTAQYALMLGLPSYALLAFAPSTSVVVFAIIVGAGTGVVIPALQGLMTARVAENAQGELQGALVSASSLSAIVGSMAMTHIFSHFSDMEGLFFPGAPYLLSFAILIPAIAIIRHATT